MGLPANRIFKEGSTGRKLRLAAKDADGDLINLAIMSAVSVYAIDKGRQSSATLLTHSVIAGQAYNLEVEVDPLDPGTFLVEVNITDGGGDLYQLPETSQGLEIEIVPKVS